MHVSTISRALDPAQPAIRSRPTSPSKISKASKRLGYRQNARGLFAQDQPVAHHRRGHSGHHRPGLSADHPRHRGRPGASTAMSRCWPIPTATRGARRKVIETHAAARHRRADPGERAAQRRSWCRGWPPVMPVVTVSRRTDDPRFSSVVHDEDDGIGRLVTHLVSLGHRDIACDRRPADRVDRLQPLCQLSPASRACWDCEHRPLLVVVRQGLQREGRRALRRGAAGRRAGRSPPSSAPTTGWRSARSRRLRRHGIDCPGDVSVTGFNDMPLADRLSPSLTTVRVQHYKAGFEAARLIWSTSSRTRPPSRIIWCCRSS